MRHLALLIVATLLAGCAMPASSESPNAATVEPSASASPSATVEASPSASPVPSASHAPPVAPAFHIGDRVAVTADGAGLAVRVSPALTSPMLARLVRPDETSGDYSLASPELRLAAGEVVRVDLGPLCVHELCWYRAHNTDPLVGWDDDRDGQMDT